MKSVFRKVLSIFLAFCLISSTFSLSSAVGADGSKSSEPNPDPGGGGSSTIIYTLTASKLTGTKAGSRFYKNDLPNGDTKLVASGKLTHTAPSGLTTPTIRAGIAFASGSSNNIVPQYYQDFNGNTANVYKAVNISSLSTSGRYCGFITNSSPNYGTVSGSLKVYTY